MNHTGGGSSDYYDLPLNCRTLTDIAYAKDMGFIQYNIFKAAYRWDIKPSLVYNLEKIIWFAAFALEKLRPGAPSKIAKSAEKLASLVQK